MADDLMMRRVLQFAFSEQWRALRHYCAQKSIRIVGDIAIFVNYDSADVWRHPELFRLDASRLREGERHRAGTVQGAPMFGGTRNCSGSMALAFPQSPPEFLPTSSARHLSATATPSRVASTW